MQSVCNICQSTFIKKRNLSKHLRLCHKIVYRDYVLKYEHNDVWPLCLCGCGEKVKFFNGKFYMYVFKHHHNDKANIAKRSISLKKAWEKNQERKLQFAIQQKNAWKIQEKATKMISAMRDAWKNVELRARHSKKMTEVHNNNDYRVMMQKISSSQASSLKRHETMKRRQRYGKSIVEDKLYDVLVSVFGIDDVERQVYINGWSIDFFIKSLNLYIQYNGLYWHGIDKRLNKHKGPRSSSIKKTIIRDEQRAKFFEAHDMQLLVLTDDDFQVKYGLHINVNENMKEKLIIRLKQMQLDDLQNKTKK